MLFLQLCSKAMEFTPLRIFSDAPVMRFFDANAESSQSSATPSRSTNLSNMCREHWQKLSAILCSGREREMLAIVFILERFEQYVYGRHTGVETYREPLIPIHKKTAADATQNTKMRV